MITIPIKPLSVNEVWKGKRYRSKKYDKYERDMILILPNMTLPDPPYTIYFEFGFSNSLADWDNPIKPAQDILQKRYGFNDKNVKRGVVEKVMVKKGQEYIKFKIEHYESL
jgi:Holliday junction resolvase RusA-like endonuclease